MSIHQKRQSVVDDWTIATYKKVLERAISELIVNWEQSAHEVVSSIKLKHYTVPDIGNFSRFMPGIGGEVIDVTCHQTLIPKCQVVLTLKSERRKRKKAK